MNQFPTLKQANLKIFFSIIVTSLFLITIYKYINWKEFIQAIATTPPKIIIITSALLLINYLFRTFRINLLLSHQLPMGSLYLITITHNALTQLLPFRSGELSFFYFISRLKEMTFVSAALPLITARLLDIIIIIFILAQGTLLNGIPWLLENTIPYLILTTALFLLLFTHAKMIITTIYNYTLQRPHIHALIANRLPRKEQFLTFARHTLNEKTLFLLALYSLSIWGVYYLLMYALFTYFHLAIPPTIFLLILSTALLFSIIPIQGLGGFGTSEGSLVFGLVLFAHIDKMVALEKTLLIHTVGLTTTILLGIISGCVFLILLKRRRPV